MKKSSTGNWRQLLHEAGYKATPPRLAILEYLAKQAKPVTVPELVKRLRKYDIDSVTAYRTLTLLKDSGLVRQIDFQQGISFYELAAHGEHHHVICTNCERVEDIVECCVEDDMHAKALHQSGFAAITTHSLEFFGLCKECAV